ncbi:MAG TPA: PAS domain S-box protein [Pontibacter sp.]
MLHPRELVNKTKENRRLLTGLISGLFLFAALIFGIFYNLKRESEITQWVLHSHEEIFQIEKVVSLMKDYETGSRGFLLTGKVAYETPLHEADRQLEGVIATLSRLTESDAVQRRNLDSLTFYLRKKSAFSTSVVRVMMEQGQEEGMKLFHTGLGKKYMDKIRRYADMMHQHANKDLALRKLQSEQATGTTNHILTFSIIFFGALLLYATWKSWQQAQERKVAEEGLRIEKAFSEALLEASPDGMIGYNQDGEIILFNQRATDLLGYAPDEILGAPIETLLPHELREQHLTRRADIFTNPARARLQDNGSEIYGLRKDGSRFPADVRLSLVNSYKGEIMIASVRDITQRKKADEQLKESEKNLQAILSSSQEAIYLLNLDCRVMLLNDHSRSIIKQSFGVDCKPGDNFLALFEPALSANLKAIFDKVLAGEKVETERTFLLEDGEAYYYSTYFPVKDNDGTIIGICCASKNITHRKKSEEEVKRANAETEEYQSRFKAILDYSPQAILIRDVEGEHIFSNKAFQQLFKLNLNAEISQQLNNVLDDQAVRREFLATLEEDEQPEIRSKEWTQQVLLEDGRALEMEIIKFPLYDRQKRLFGICTLWKDITEQMLHHQQLIEARENAEQAERLQEQFLANMSHELRTPMNGIIGMVNLLLTSSSLQPDQKGRLQVIKHSSDTLLNLINDILDLSKIKAGMLTIEKVNFDFNETIAGTAMMFREKAKEKGIKLAVSADPFIPRHLTGDPHRLNQILSNLLSNAVKFTEKGFVKLEATLQSETDEQAIVEFVVTDSGIGIDTGKLQHIFDNFAQESADISSKYGGTGLGLAITKRLIEMQGGEIAVESVKDKGTTFSFAIPYMISTDTNTVVSTGFYTTAEPDRKDYSGKRALIVEDNEINQAVLASTLKQHHMDYVIANNGQEAVDILQAGATFDIIFMDLRMPVMNGFQATAYIRQTLQLATPIVVLTASVLRNERDRCLEIGASEYMAKPFSMPDLARALEQFVSVTTPEAGAIPVAQKAVAAPQENQFDITRLLELGDPTFIRKVHQLFTENIPVYLQELRDFSATDNRADFLEKTHKLKGSISAIQINEMYQLLLQMEAEAEEQEHLSAFLPLLDKCSALYTSLMPAITREVEASLSELEA